KIVRADGGLARGWPEPAVFTGLICQQPMLGVESILVKMARPQRYVINLEQARIAQIKRGKRHDVVINATDYLTYLIGKPQCEILGQPQAPGDLKSLMESAVICTKSL